MSCSHFVEVLWSVVNLDYYPVTGCDCIGISSFGSEGWYAYDICLFVPCCQRVLIFSDFVVLSFLLHAAGTSAVSSTSISTSTASLTKSDAKRCQVWDVIVVSVASDC